MSFLRRHLFPLLATLVALAVGIAVGNGPLQGEDSASDGAALKAQNSRLAGHISSLRQGGLFTERFSEVAAPRLLSGRLNDRPVSIFALPGVDDAQVADIEESIRQAGGVPVATVRVGADYVDPSQKTYVDSVAENSFKRTEFPDESPADDTYGRIGALVARAYTGHGTHVLFDDEATKIDGQLEGAKLVDVPGEPDRRGNLAVVLGTAEHGKDQLTAASHLIETDLVVALAAGSDGVLVAAPATSSARGGLVDMVSRRDDLARVSTLNQLGGTAARVAAVYALSAVAAGNNGQFGVEGEDVALPPGLSVPAQ